MWRHKWCRNRMCRGKKGTERKVYRKLEEIEELERGPKVEG